MLRHSLEIDNGHVKITKRPKAKRAVKAYISSFQQDTRLDLLGPTYTLRDTTIL